MRELLRGRRLRAKLNGIRSKLDGLDHLSLITVPVSLFFNETHLSDATAFVWRKNNRIYLVTNWHVVSGRNSVTGTNIRCDGGRPNRMVAKFLSATSLTWKNEVSIDLSDDDGHPKWLVYTPRPPGNELERSAEELKGLQEGVDLAILPLIPAPVGVQLFPANEYASDQSLPIEIGMDVFVLGYPFGARPPALPVWKRGSIASEPELVRSQAGFYLVDTASRPGMSGSPVVLRSRLNGREVGGRPRDRFVGVYSGRLSAGVSGAQIGRVWHASFIDEIIDADIACRPAEGQR